MKAITPKELDVSKLRSEEIQDSSNSGINQLEPLKQENVWEDFKEKIYVTAKNVLGIKNRRHHVSFGENDAEIKGLLKEKHWLYEETINNSGEGEKRYNFQKHKDRSSETST